MDIKKVKISDLIPDPNNARKHSQKNLDAIKGSLAKFGQQKPIVIDEKNIILAGNGTLQAAKALNWDHLDCVVTSLKDYEKTAFALADNRTAELAEWDDDILESSLKALDEQDFDITAIGFDDDFLKELDSSGSDDGDELYTKKIQAPIYEITGEKPKIEELVNFEKTQTLIKDIEASALSDKEKEFLKFAAYRHNVFSYEKIAEYYAHSSKETQDLMERSALVIIDFNKAVENGFVVLTKEILENYIDDDDNE